MGPITIRRKEKILAHHTTESYLSHYGQPVWTIEDEDPKPGRATWEQDGKEQEIDILGVKAGWLIVRQSDGYLAGIIWSDGGYFANLLEDSDGTPCRKLKKKGLRIRDTIQLDPDDSEDLGAVLM